MKKNTLLETFDCERSFDLDAYNTYNFQFINENNFYFQEQKPKMSPKIKAVSSQADKKGIKRQTLNSVGESRFSGEYIETVA